MFEKNAINKAKASHKYEMVHISNVYSPTLIHYFPESVSSF